MVTIRPVSSSDDASVKEMVFSILDKEFPSKEDRSYLSGDMEHVSKNYSSQGDTFLVACSDKQIVGTIGIKKEDERNALMRRIFVMPEYRGKKIGAQLIQKAVAFCKDYGYQEIIFKTTSRMEDAIRLVQSNGFVKRATINLGGLDLFKFTMFLEREKNNHAHISEKEKGRRA